MNKDEQMANFIYDVIMNNNDARKEIDAREDVDQEVGGNVITFKWNDQSVRITVESEPL